MGQEDGVNDRTGLSGNGDRLGGSCRGDGCKVQRLDSSTPFTFLLQDLVDDAELTWVDE